MATLSQIPKGRGAETIIGPSRTDDGIVQTTNLKRATKVEVVSNQLVPGSSPGVGAIIKMSKQSDRVKKWRRATKDRIIESMGGSCVCCGYNRCQSALALHHLDPAQKDFGLGSVRASIKNWNIIVQELKKCILVCHNCHNEIHEGITTLPEKYNLFSSSFEDYKLLLKNKSKSNCPICKEPMPMKNKYCSLSCSSKSKSKINWSAIDLVEKIKNTNISKIAEDIGCSDAAVHKRLKKLGLKS